jgi:hypothetical protein
MKKTIQLSSQNHLVCSTQFKAGQQGVLSRPAHVQAGDDVQNFYYELLAQMSKDVPVTKHIELNLQSNSEVWRIKSLNTLTNPVIL